MLNFLRWLILDDPKEFVKLFIGSALFVVFIFVFIWVLAIAFPDYM